MVPVRPDRRSPGRRGATTVVAAAVLSAVLAAGGTAALVTGPLRSTAASQAPASSAAPAGVTVASGAGTAGVPELTEVVAKVRDSVVTITSEGISSRGLLNIPSTGGRLRGRADH